MNKDKILITGLALTRVTSHIVSTLLLIASIFLTIFGETPQKIYFKNCLPEQVVH